MSRKGQEKQVRVRELMEYYRDLAREFGGILRDGGKVGESKTLMDFNIGIHVPENYKPHPLFSYREGIDATAGKVLDLYQAFRQTQARLLG